MKIPSSTAKKIDNSSKRAVNFLRNLPFSITVILGSLVILFFKINTLIPFSPSENPHLIGSATVDEIRNHIIYAPIKVVQIVILKFTSDDVWIRLASALAASFAALILYLLLRKWFTRRISLLTTVMYVTSSWFLHNGRLAGVDILFMTVWPVLLLVCMWLLTQHHDRKLPVAAVLIALTLYIPGTWLFLLAGIITFRRIFFRAYTRLSNKVRLFSIGAFIVTLLPLFYSFLRGQKQILEWLGWEYNQSLSPLHFLRNFWEIPKQLFISGPSESMQWLSGTPVFDVFSLSMLLLGFYAYRAGYYPAREKLVFGAIILSVLMIGIGSVASIGLLLPLLYIVIANGLAYMLQSWFTVFPKNPIARSVGVILLMIVIILSCSYQIQRYYIAWPKAPATKAALNQRV